MRLIEVMLVSHLHINAQLLLALHSPTVQGFFVLEYNLVILDKDKQLSMKMMGFLSFVYAN